jgi:5-carboxymethyl-2-hydroxymuconate isomerase
VYEVTVCDYPNNRAYRIINPDYKTKHDAEASMRGVQSRQAWDDVNYVDLDVDDDFIQKGLAIRAGNSYDTRVQVELDLDDDLLLQLMTQAHKQDITLNKMVEQILTEMIDRTQKSQTESQRQL